MVKLLQFTLHKKEAAIHSSEKPTKFGKTTAENSFLCTFSKFNYPNLIRMKLTKAKFSKILTACSNHQFYGSDQGYLCNAQS